MIKTFNNLHYIVQDALFDPAYNLALEEYAVRNLPPYNDYLLLYVNSPSVILGKHQNVVEEVNQQYCVEHNIPILRRISGGGTVFHDPGNLNFSFITAHTLKKFNNYRIFIKPLLEILQNYDNAVKLDDNNNLVFQGLKLSGNAQFTTGGRMLSHGTLLFSANLKHLHSSLKIDPDMRVESRSTKSRRSSVGNLNNFDVFHQLSIEQFRQVLLDHIFQGSLSKYQLSQADGQKIRELASSKYQDWEWNYGRSPACMIHKNDLELEIINGRIIKIDCSKSGMAEFNLQKLVGLKYDYGIISSLLFEWDKLANSQATNSEKILSLLF